LRNTLALLVEVKQGLPKAKLELCFNLSLNNLAALHQRLDRPEAALLCLQEAECFCDALPYGDAAATHMSLCAQLSKLGRHEEAERSALEALKLSEADVLALPTTSELGGAQAAANIMRDKVSTLAVACNNLAVQREYLGQTSECLALYEKAVVLAEGQMDKDSPLLERLRDSHRKALHVADEQRAAEAFRSNYAVQSSYRGVGNMQAPRRLPPILSDNGRPFSALASRQANERQSLATAVRAHERASSASAVPAASAAERPQRSRERRQGGITDVYGSSTPRASDQEILSARSLSKELAGLLRPDNNPPQAIHKKRASSREIEHPAPVAASQHEDQAETGNTIEKPIKKVTTQTIGTQTAKEANGSQPSQSVTRCRSTGRRTSSCEQQNRCRESKPVSQREAKTDSTKVSKSEARKPNACELALSIHSSKVVERKDAGVQPQPCELQESLESDSRCSSKGMVAPESTRVQQQQLESIDAQKSHSRCGSKEKVALNAVETQQQPFAPIEEQQQPLEVAELSSACNSKGKDLQTSSIEQDIKIHNEKPFGDIPRLDGPNLQANREIGQEPEAECPPDSTSRASSISSLPLGAPPRPEAGMNQSSVPPTPPTRRPPKDSLIAPAPSLSLPSLGGGQKAKTPATSIGGLPPLAQPSRRSLESHCSISTQSQLTASQGQCSVSCSSLPGLPEVRNRASRDPGSTPSSPKDDLKAKEEFAMLLQSIFRGYLGHQRFRRQVDAAVVLQVAFRRHQTYRHTKAAMRLQSALRTLRERCSFLRKASAASTLQRRWRQHQGQQRLRCAAASRIQKSWRRCLERQKLQLSTAKTVAQLWITNLVEVAAAEVAISRKHAATKLQSAFRGASTRRRMQVNGMLLASDIRASDGGALDCEVLCICSRRGENKPFWRFAASLDETVCNAAAQATLTISNDDALEMYRQYVDDAETRNLSRIAEVILKYTLVSWCDDELSLSLPRATGVTDEPGNARVDEPETELFAAKSPFDKDVQGKCSVDSAIGEPEPFVEPPPDSQNSASADEVCKVSPDDGVDSTILSAECNNVDTTLPWICGSCGFNNEVSPSVCVLCDAEKSMEATR
jgi:tetratricopeptide (TPR) repeat protein